MKPFLVAKIQWQFRHFLAVQFYYFISENIIIIYLHATEKASATRKKGGARAPASGYALVSPRTRVKGKTLDQSAQAPHQVYQKRQSETASGTISALMFLRVAMATLSREATQGTSALMFLRVAAAPLSRVVNMVLPRSKTTFLPVNVLIAIA